MELKNYINEESNKIIKGKKTIERGDLLYVNFGKKEKNEGSEQSGKRFAVVLQNDKGNKYSPTIIVAACTSKTKNLLPTHVNIGHIFDDDERETLVLLEQIRTIDKTRIEYNYGQLSEYKIKLINKALKISLSLL